MPYLGFTDETSKWYTPYLSNRKLIISAENALRTCSVPQGSILGPLLFLIYINVMPQAMDSELSLYADDTCLVFTIKEHLNRDFSTLIDWFVDSKLRVHFYDDKAKSILFSPKHRSKTVQQIDISCKDVKIKQYSKVTDLGYVLDERLIGESMAMQLCPKTTSKPTFYINKRVSC